MQRNLSLLYMVVYLLEVLLIPPLWQQQDRPEINMTPTINYLNLIYIRIIIARQLICNSTSFLRFRLCSFHTRCVRQLIL
jgi:hypothetical protein